MIQISCNLRHFYYRGKALTSRKNAPAFCFFWRGCAILRPSSALRRNYTRIVVSYYSSWTGDRRYPVVPGEGSVGDSSDEELGTFYDIHKENFEARMSDNCDGPLVRYAKEALRRKMSLTRFIKKWHSFFFKNRYNPVLNKFTVVFLSTPWAQTLKGGAATFKQMLVYTLLGNIKQFPSELGDEFSAMTILRGRVEEGPLFIETWSMLYEICEDYPDYKKRLVEDLFIMLIVLDAPREGDYFYYFFSGSWLCDVKAWRKILGNPPANWHMAGEFRTEADLIATTLRQALTLSQLNRIFGLANEPFSPVRVDWWKKKFTFAEVAEVWKALFDYFQPGSKERTVLLKLAEGYRV